MLRRLAQRAVAEAGAPGCPSELHQRDDQRPDDQHDEEPGGLAVRDPGE
jgi:hypothetical protein